MKDREKIELGIRSCWSEYFAHKCYDCPYMSERDDKKCVERLGADVLALLKEQEAVKPIRKLAYTKQGWFCGNCDNRLNRNGKYCSFCGKPVLWEGR